MTSSKILAVICLCAALGACAAGPQQAANVALPAAPPPGEPNGLPGMDAQALRVAFGSPAFVRKDGQMQMWRYDNPSCRAFFFLYANGNAFAVRHVETVPRGREMAADENCLALLRAAHPPPPVS